MIKHLKILAHDYPILIDKELISSNNAYANHDPSAVTISIDSISVKNHPEVHLMHEVFESLVWQLAARDEKLDHNMLTAVSNAICAVLKDNPNFTKMFLGA